MDTVLIVLTCASVAAAAAFAINAWRTRADEARRSAARVAALSQAIDTAEPAAIAAHTDRRPVAITSMFTTEPGASVQGRPLVKLGIFGGLGVAFLIAVAIVNSDHPAAPVAVASAEAPLELVSMQHAREGRSLTVSWLVRNPRGSVSRANISAVVSALDRSGAVVANGRAALDFTTLAPGDESPFVVKIRDVSGVVRYRVSFRTDAGVVRHLDRRADQVQASAS